MIKLAIKINFIIVILSSNLIKAQDFYGQATYQTKTDLGKITKKNQEMDDESMKKFEEAMKKALEKTFTLNFNRFESIFFEEQKLETPKSESKGFVFAVQNSGETKNYKNIKEKIEISEEDIFGKEFLVTDSLQTLNWQMGTETKKIGAYTCYKATAIIPASNKKTENNEDRKKEDKNTNLQFGVSNEASKDKLITAWYTPEIPIGHGPASYWGLPGLILEVNDGTTIMLCSKIVLNPKEKKAIKKPTKGKQITKDEYKVIMEKQLEKMKNARGNANTIEIRR
ncbi:GLPGLI family protein [Flavobacterium sp. F-65]|uniref:GLPGLI family protein n=1 Tax=Flavobacterium pisciphilum TaxID=2893755 RepID=A0ABS8N077_9FLAO|nr:GLPGLI family protein [Flavobacterium sp. F-65]MCC9074434.1 GLPGLI family protein [Flavobacterium sp. F-65]